MCSPVVAELTESLLANYRANQLGVSFAGKVLKWNTGEDVTDLVEAIKNCPTLKYLELEGNTLGVNAAIEIGKALESKPEFEAALWKDLFTGRLKNEIPQAMKYLFSGVDLAGARLQYLDLSDNAIGPLGMVGLAPFFQSPSSFSIKTLICQNNGLGPEGAKEFSKALISCRELSIKKGGEVFNLKKLMCGRNRMQNAGSLAMSKFIQVCDSLEEIHMPENSIMGAAHVEIAKGLANNPKLRVVNFNDNTINGKGLDAFVDVIGSLSNLEELNLGDCLLKSQGAMLVVTAIKDLPNLRSLVLEGNEINGNAGMRIADMLESHQNLQALNLSSNPFGEEVLSVVRSKLIRIPNLNTEECEEEADEEEEEDGEGEGEDGSEEEDYDEEGEVRSEEEVEGEGHSEDDDYSDVEDVEETMDKILTFINEPTLEAYRSIPEPGLAEYVYDIPNDDGQPFEIFLNGAIGLLEDSVSKGNESFDAKCAFFEMMGEAANLADGMNKQFSSALLIALGFLKNGDNEYVRNEISVPLLQCLSVWLIKDDQHKSTDLIDNTISSLKIAFANPRPDLDVDRSKLSTLVDYVIAKRRELIQSN